VLWPLLLADHLSQLRLEGGTHNPMAPSASYLQWTLPQVLAQTGGTVALTLERHGFYPAGGGAVSVHITPTDALQALCFLERGALTAAHAVCLHAAMPTGVAQRELATVGQLLGWLPEQLHDRALRQNEGPGNALLAVLQYEHFTEVFAEYGQRSVSAEQVAKHLVKQVRQYQTNAAPVGEYTADQLMLPLALACAAGHTSAGYVATNISKHATTHAAVIEAFLPVKFDLQMRAGNARFCVNHLQQTERE
jgi:RNA 3'-terminal phosphate cyclase (ATP)